MFLQYYIFMILTQVTVLQDAKKKKRVYILFLLQNNFSPIILLLDIIWPRERLPNSL